MNKAERIQAIERIISEYPKSDKLRSAKDLLHPKHINKIATAIEEAIGVDEVDIDIETKRLYQYMALTPRDRGQLESVKKFIKEISTNKEVIKIDPS